MNEIFVIDPDTIPRAPDKAEVPLLHTFEDIVQHFAPLTIDQSRGWDVTPEGAPCWALVGFHVTVGSTVIKSIVRDINGNYLPGKLVNCFFPGAPNQLAHGGQPAYFSSGFSIATKAEEGEGAHLTVTGDHNVAPNHAGPDSIWVAAEPGGPQTSDAVHGLGMRVNTNHLIVSPIFQEVVKTGSPPPPPPPDDEPDEDEPDVPEPTSSNNFFSIVVNGQEIGRIPFSQAGPG